MIGRITFTEYRIKEQTIIMFLDTEKGTIQYNTIQYNTIQYNAMQCNAMQCNAMQYNTIQYNTIQYNKFYLKSENIKHYNTSPNELLNPTYRSFVDRKFYQYIFFSIFIGIVAQFSRLLLFILFVLHLVSRRTIRYSLSFLVGRFP